MKRITFFIFATLLCVTFVSAAPTTGLKFSATSNASIIALDQNAAFSPSQFTVEVWVNYQVLNGGGYIISTEGWNPTNHGFSLRLNGNKLDFAVGFGNNWPEIKSVNDITPNTWFHAAATCSGTEIKLYINGVEESTMTIASPMAVSTDKITLGDSPAWPGRLFNGIMGDLRFWNVVRTPAEITADMTSTLTGTEAGLVAGWKMNEGAGTAVAEVTGLYNLTKTAEVTWFGLTSGVNPVLNNSTDITFSVNGRNLEVTNNTKGNAQFAVYSVNGQKIMEYVVASGKTLQKQLTNTKGAYILKSVAADGSSYSKKFIIAE